MWVCSCLSRAIWVLKLLSRSSHLLGLSSWRKGPQSTGWGLVQIPEVVHFWGSFPRRPSDCLVRSELLSNSSLSWLLSWARVLGSLILTGLKSFSWFIWCKSNGWSGEDSPPWAREKLPTSKSSTPAPEDDFSIGKLCFGVRSLVSGFFSKSKRNVKVPLLFYAERHITIVETEETKNNRIVLMEVWEFSGKLRREWEKDGKHGKQGRVRMRQKRDHSGGLNLTKMQTQENAEETRERAGTGVCQHFPDHGRQVTTLLKNWSLWP